MARLAILAVAGAAGLFPRLAILGRTFHADEHGRVGVPVRCPASTPAPRGCVGRLILRDGSRTLARAHLALVRGERATVRLRLGTATRVRLARERRLRLTLSVHVEDLVTRHLRVTVAVPE